MLKRMTNSNGDVTVMLIDNHNLTDLKFLKNFPHLEQLIIRTEQVDVSELAHLENLKHLKLINMGLDDEDIRVVENFPNLKTLSLAVNYISDVSSLQSLKSLKCLCLWKNEITDISPLYDLHLTDLNVGLNLIEDIDLDRFNSDLWYLNVFKNPFKSKKLLKYSTINHPTKYYVDYCEHDPIFGFIESVTAYIGDRLKSR